MPFGISVWELLILLLLVALVSVPAYVIGTRREVDSPWLAFIPYVGPWIVLLRSVGTTAWWTALIFVPYLGAFALFRLAGFRHSEPPRTFGMVDACVHLPARSHTGPTPSHCTTRARLSLQALRSSL